MAWVSADWPQLTQNFPVSWWLQFLQVVEDMAQK